MNEQVEGKLNVIGQQVNKLVVATFEVRDTISTLASKQELSVLREEVARGFDEQLVILQRLDQERVFTFERIRRIEEDVERLKVRLNIV